MTALRRILSALWNTKGTIMNFFRRTNIFQMLIAWITEQLAANGLHCFIARSCAVAARKWHDSFDINKRTAAILVKIMSIFLGDPTLGKYFLYFFPDQLQGRRLHQSMPR
jgi:hypothetical protein